MIIVIMGVVGAGKTTIGKLLSQELGWKFADADDYHPPANIEKIRQGIPLNDEDRKPWLERLHNLLLSWDGSKLSGVLACSALKRSYRDELDISKQVRFIYLHGTSELIARRLHERHGHFANDEILASQFADLEEPESAIRVSIAQTPEEIVAEIRNRLALS